MSDHMRKKLWAKLQSTFSMAPGRPQKEKEGASSLSSKLNINEEYVQAFRTKSYIELWSKAHDNMGTPSIDRLPSSSSSSLPLFNHLSEYLLEPRQETLMDKTESLNFHDLLVHYFEASLEACNVCELLLQSIHQTRVLQMKIKRVIKLSKRVINRASFADEDECDVIFEELARFALLKNPLSSVSSAEFRDFHDSNLVLLHRLTSKRKNIRRRLKFVAICKKIAGYGLVISHSALVITLMIIALHTIVGLAVAPGILTCSMFVSLKKKLKLTRRSSRERLGAQLDIAAKGTFILINDFDTICVLMRRLHDEIEHRKAIAHMCVRYGRSEVLKEVVKEFYMHQSTFLEQLEELEEHVYLCFHNINRSRRLVIQETML